MQEFDQSLGGVSNNLLSKLTLGQVVIDQAAHKVFIKDQRVEFSRREFSLLSKLIEQTGKVVTRDVLSQALYGWGDDVDSNAIEVHIHHIRKKSVMQYLLKPFVVLAILPKINHALYSSVSRCKPSHRRLVCN